MSGLKIKTGIIGAGYWGKKHVEEYNALGLETFVSDLSAENLKFCSDKYGSTTYSDYRKILGDPSIKTVSICTPNSTHYKICREALESGKNVLVEKPFTLTYDKALELIKIAESKKLTLTVGHIYRFNNAIEKVKALVASGALGDIYTVNFKWTNLEPVWADRDIIFDLGAHPLDIVLNIFGKTPKNVFCNGAGFRQENPEAAIINYNLGNVFVSMELSWVNPVKARVMTIVGSKKTLEADCVNQTIKMTDNATKSVTDVPVLRNNTLGDELAHFIDSANSGRRAIHDAEIGGRVVRLLELASNSLQQKKVLSILNGAEL